MLFLTLENILDDDVSDLRGWSDMFGNAMLLVSAVKLTFAGVV